MGIIYLLESPSGRKYIGQTITHLEKRWKEHVDSSRRVYKDHCKILNRSIRKYGDKHFKKEILISCNDEDLDEYEIKYIEQYNTITPYGMNIKDGGKSGKHHEDTKVKISASLEGRLVSRETRLKLSDTVNKDLPMYLIKHKKGYRVCNHPNGPEKRFISKTKGDEYNLNRALEYLNILDNLKTPLEKKERLLEKYIRIHKNGYLVAHPGYKNKYFVSKTKSNEELYKLSLEYLKSTSAVQRLNVSGL